MDVGSGDAIIDEHQRRTAPPIAWADFDRVAAAIERGAYLAAAFHAYALYQGAAAAGQLELGLHAANVWATLQHARGVDLPQLAFTVRQLAMRARDDVHFES